MAGVASARVANRHALALGLLQHGEKKNVTAERNVRANGVRHAATRFGDTCARQVRVHTPRDKNLRTSRENSKNYDEIRSYAATNVRCKCILPTNFPHKMRYVLHQCSLRRPCSRIEIILHRRRYARRFNPKIDQTGRIDRCDSGSIRHP